MNGIGWITVAEAARLCGTDELRITLWMNGNHIAYARFDGILMIDGASIAALFSRNRVATIYEDVAQQRGKPTGFQGLVPVIPAIQINKCGNVALITKLFPDMFCSLRDKFYICNQ